MEDHDTQDGAAVEEEILDLVDTLAKDKPPGPGPVRRRGPSHERIMLVLAVGVLIASAALTVANLSGSGPFNRGRPDPTPEEIQSQLELDLLASVGYVESFREDHGRLPDNLAELEIDPPANLSYQRVSDDHFIVTLGHPPASLSYDSDTDADQPAAEGGGTP